MLYLPADKLRLVRTGTTRKIENVTYGPESPAIFGLAFEIHLLVSIWLLVPRSPRAHTTPRRLSPVTA